MQVGLDQQTSANCKSRLLFGLDKQLSTLVLNFHHQFFNQQRLWADGMLIPNLHKALLVMCNFKTTVNQIFKKHWLTILLSIGLMSTTIVIVNKNKEIKSLNYEISDLEDKVSTLENEKEELESELEDCKSEKDDFESSSNNQSYDNSSLQNDNSDLEYKIRNLESKLDDCERKLRDCN